MAYNFTTIENEVLDLGNGAQPIFICGVACTAVGYPIGHFWVRKMDGIFQSADEVQALPSDAPAASPAGRYSDRRVQPDEGALARAAALDTHRR